LFKAVKEIHHTVLHPHGDTQSKQGIAATLTQALVQIIALDMVFSLDSVITAVGLTQNILVMVSAVLISVVCILAISGPIVQFIRKNPALKVLALSFLVVIGVVIILEGFHQHISKSLIYLPLGFCLVVELLQMFQTKRSQPSSLLEAPALSSLSPAELGNAYVWYIQHKDHVTSLTATVTAAYPPTLSEDKSNPDLWKSEHWKWFLNATA
jgi:hypothetical protein